jgi:hypothetical protein
MKHLVLTFLIAMALLTVYPQGFYGGVLAGFNGSQVEGDIASGYNKMGIVGGAWVHRDLTSRFFWGMELKFNQKGSRVLPNKRNDYHKYVYRLNYIDLPVLAGYNHFDQFSVYGGLSYGYLINKSGYDNFGLDPMIQYDYISDWEIGMLTGIKVNFEQLVQQSWAKNFTLEARLQFSMFSIDDKHDFFTKNFSVGQYNNVISTVLLYRIDRPMGR